MKSSISAGKYTKTSLLPTHSMLYDYVKNWYFSELEKVNDITGHIWAVFDEERKNH
ncbi:hypothetical protein U0035_05540 [Niabella yanshanensis]|uniref:Uncharacterized protein n=1 Tax=Niabella yanshanensis TaxID=577386 RepID=A0ABZ0W9I4_9BACT|nr:hypothetical protein [Niabella yanshanensis]WQD39609.1 hypothetical protein U0035_05540 [Niabella yanshanensis]